MLLTLLKIVIPVFVSNQDDEFGNLSESLGAPRVLQLWQQSVRLGQDRLSKFIHFSGRIRRLFAIPNLKSLVYTIKLFFLSIASERWLPKFNKCISMKWIYWNLNSAHRFLFCTDNRHATCVSIVTNSWSTIINYA